VQEIELAEAIKARFPGMDQIRFVNSGTEATMSALRLSRAYTGRTKIIKFRGCYHGHADLLLVQAGSGVSTLGLPDSPGVPKATTADTLVAQFNDVDSVEKLFSQFPEQIAAVIIEPVAGNMGVVPPQPGFLLQLRGLTLEHGALLIFDEVMTGFRVHPSGAQALYEVEPDLTVLGKVIGGGLPVGAYGGPAEIMSLLAPEGPVYQAGTLSGNPLAMQAGLATLNALNDGDTWQRAARAAERISRGLLELAESAGIPASGHQVGSMLSLFFTSQAPVNYEEVRASDTERYARFFHAMLDGGVYLAPSQFEAAFTSSAHDERAIEITLQAAELAFRAKI
jgi:glutamate-1-semialdehyde 2,1-aminomutase